MAAAHPFPLSSRSSLAIVISALASAPTRIGAFRGSLHPLIASPSRSLAIGRALPAPAAGRHSASMSMSSSLNDGGPPASPAEEGRQKRAGFPPSRSVVDPSGRRWRLCAAAAVLETSSDPPRLLIGERLGAPGSWQCPQGGVDDADPDSNDPKRRERPETVAEAAARELYEEMGLEAGRHVVPVVEPSSSADDCGGIRGVAPVRYETTGTGSWLEKSGYAGQELRWVVFRCVDDDCRDDPAKVCDLSGKNGERPEFSAVRWADVDEAVEGVWEKKREPYEALRSHLREKGIL